MTQAPAGARGRAALRAGLSTPAGQINAVMLVAFACGCAVFSFECSHFCLNAHCV